MAADTRTVPAEEELAPAGYRTQAADTTYQIERLLVDTWRSMPPWEKAARLVQCCRAVEQLSAAGLRLRYPDAGEGELRLRAAALRLGRALMLDVFGWDPDAQHT